MVCGLVRQIPSGLRPPHHDNQVKNKSAQLPLISRSYEDECFAKRPVQLAVGSATAFFQSGPKIVMVNSPSDDSTLSGNADDIDMHIKPWFQDAMPMKFETVLKDGFKNVGCISDFMYAHGNKAIVRYDVAIAKEHQKDMTPGICFEFCRTVPGVDTFGLLNGESCYCAPYTQSMAGDSSACDVICTGDQKQVCGGKSKSTVFKMHKCSSFEKLDLEASAMKATLAVQQMQKKVNRAMSLSTDMRDAASSLKPSLNAAGDTAALDLMQKVQASAVTLDKQAQEVVAVSSELSSLVQSSKRLTGSVQQLNSIMRALLRTQTKGQEVMANITLCMDSATVSAGAENHLQDFEQYSPLLHFIIKDFATTPSTCGGDMIGDPMVGVSLNDCAWRCNEHRDSCIGFSHYAQGQLCFLMTKFTSAFYYKDCKAGGRLPAVQGPRFWKAGGRHVAVQQPRFLPQTKHAELTCMAKTSKFRGSSLKPDPAGKCEQCLKIVHWADRCYLEATHPVPKDHLQNSSMIPSGLRPPQP